MKTVYQTDMVCHLWANRHPHDVRNSAGNVYTRNGALYSYGQHHAIGAFLDSPTDGEKNLLLWNSGRTSNTTTRHASKAWFALSSVVRQSVTRVPGLNASLLADLPRLAASCIPAAIGPLQNAVRAKANKQYYVGAAKQYLESARQIYLYVGDKTAAESVPTITGTEKADIKNMLAQINKAEYLISAENYLKRAKDGAAIIDGCIDRRTSATHISHECNAVLVILQQASHAYYDAQSPEHPDIVLLREKITRIIEDYSAAARSEYIQQKRARLAQTEKQIVGALALIKRRKDIARHYRQLESEFWPAAAEYTELWPDTKTRAINIEFWESLRTRCNRVYAAYALRNSIDRTGQSVAQYIDDVDRDATRYIPPSGTNVRGCLRKYAAFCTDGEAPRYWQSIAESVADHADTIGAQHAEKLAAREAAKIAAWRAGERVAISRQLSPRVRIVGDTLETSHGARVPLEHAARLVKIAKRIAAKGGENFAPGTGPQVGHFRVTSIAADFATVIGCHNFTSDEAMHAIKLIEEATESMEVAK